MPDKLYDPALWRTDYHRDGLRWTPADPDEPGAPADGAALDTQTTASSVYQETEGVEALDD